MRSERKKVLKVQNAVKHYRQKHLTAPDGTRLKNQLVKAVDGVSFELDSGEILGVIGESGCGKSTLGRLLVRLEPLTGGDILINGRSINSVNTANKEERLAFRRTVQLIFQNPFESVDPRETVERILMTPLRLHSIGSGDDERRKICIEALETAGLRPAEDFLSRYPYELSGGQLQRIAIMRAMILNPSFVVADEPISMLDVSIRADILSLLEEQTKKKQACMVFISHDIATTRYISDKVAVMYLGRIVEYGSTDDVMHNPIHPYTRALISNSASIDPDEKRQVIEIQGEPPSPVGTGPGCYFAPRCYMRTERCETEYPPMTDCGNGHCFSCFNQQPTDEKEQKP
ncbi:MAG: oligopeptide/dipeptide ABC transporter ATP-binding protein [Christensenellales bacterium]|jgi:oligopeptide/dipeptide ABC transporter ATP-binding protein